MNNKKFQLCPAEKLFVSEPQPEHFGNPPNPSNNTSWTNKNWLKSRFHFSFAEYHDPTNQSFGVLRVMNDDLVQPDRGFGEHPHRDMEIVSYIVDGNLTHKDSKGNQESLGRGSIQYMTAGTGVYHSEYNLSKTEHCRFIQVWIVPRKRGLPVNYSSYKGDASLRTNKWQHLVGDVNEKSEATNKINQQANFWVSEFDQANPLTFNVPADKQAYILCIEGGLEVTGDHGKAAMKRHDGAKVWGANSLTFTSTEKKSHLLVIDMAKQ